MNDPMLKIYPQNAETESHTDASKFGFGAVVLQRCNDDQQLHPAYYLLYVGENEYRRIELR